MASTGHDQGVVFDSPGNPNLSGPGAFLTGLDWVR